MLARAAGSSRYLLGHDRKVATQFVDWELPVGRPAARDAVPDFDLVEVGALDGEPFRFPVVGRARGLGGFVVPGDLGAGAPVVDGEGGWVEVCVVAGVRQKWWPMVALALQHPAGRPCLARWLCLA